ncbi:MAG: succinate dehydrogenase cytochrome b subunit [Leptospiraceae bacterium]|nr:succinate dehydrogenase cytochrome b subunit [Leptospiraceae bacterium]
MSNAVKSIPVSKIKPKSMIQTSVGMKVLIAITGILLIGFVLGHMLGHLQMFAGQDKYNSYAKMLKDLGPALWVIRLGLLGIFLLHIRLAIKVTMLNKKARPQPYFNQKTQMASFASRTMILSGLVILAFVVYHLMHFTVHATNPEYNSMVDSLGRADVYGMMIASFNNIVLVAIYLIAVLVLSLHLSHGLFSALQTFGFNSPAIDSKIKLISTGFAVFIFVGYASVPVAILMGVIK